MATSRYKIRQFFQRHGIFLLVCLALVTWSVVSYLREGLFYNLIQSDAEQLVEYLASAGAWSYLLFIFIVILEVVLAPVPPLILYTVAGILFGGLYGGLLVLGGNLIGAAIDFYIGRKLAGRRLEKKINSAIWEKYQRFFKRYGTWTVFILRVNPLTSSDLVSYLAGFTKIRPVTFFLATAAGLAPLVFIQSYLGGTLIKGNAVLTGIATAVSILYLIIFFYLIAISLRHRNDGAQGEKMNKTTR